MDQFQVLWDVVSSLQVDWLSLLSLVPDNFSEDATRLSKKEGKKRLAFSFFLHVTSIVGRNTGRKKKTILAGVFLKSYKVWSMAWNGSKIIGNWPWDVKNDFEVEAEYFLRAKPVVRMDLCNNSLQLMAIAKRMHQKMEGDCMSISLLAWTTSSCFCCRLLWNHTHGFLYKLLLFL